MAAGIAFAPLPALAQHWQLSYRVHIGGVAVLDAQADLTLSGDRYSVQVDAATEGFLGRVFPWETHSRSVGAVRPDGLAPARHSQVSTLRGEPRNVTLTYDGRGGVRTEVTPPPDQDDREPVPEQLRQNTQDPLSGVVAVLLAGMRGEGCQRSMPIFDGRRRYDMQFADEGMRMVGASRYSVFAGAARQCRVSYTPIAGYNRKPETSFWRRGGAQEERAPVDVWIAPVTPGGPPLPVRLETDSGFGGVVIHLTAANVVPQTAEKPAPDKPRPAP
ncbi:DUF3108 domain-containing protein [Azospirillum sp. sgz302134]